MTILQCRCCGAALDVKKGMTVCRCDYCNVWQTVPQLDFDEKALLWERADNLRRGGEYDRALKLYSELSEISPEDPDIYWAMTLCHYGVEYVEDVVSRIRKPTLNRIQYTPVTEDADYRKAVSLAADGDQRRIYVTMAQQLEQLRSEILSVSLSEQPYDIFICYKENDASGRRTEDSVLAAQLYRSLTSEGWRVFFSRVTLEDKAGTEYEPYIFAALNSAKIMLAIGTRPEYFNAAWVRNEWSRFLAISVENSGKTLAVLYKGMLPEQLPEEFAHLQTFDMSAPDFNSELLRGVRKIIGESAAGKTPLPETTGANAAALLRRAQILLEDGDFSRADECCEEALNSEPENAQAYLLKMLAEFRLSSEEQLEELRVDFSRSGNYAKAVRFGNDRFSARLREYSLISRYNTYMQQLENAYNEEALLLIANEFDTISEYADSAYQAQLARQKAEELAERRRQEEKERRYNDAVKSYNDSVTSDDLLKAKSRFEALGGYKDSAELAAQCGKRAEELIKQEENEAYQLAVAESESRARYERIKKILLISVGAVAAAAVVISVSVAVINAAMRNAEYQKACGLLESGKYEEAIDAFGAMNGYSDSIDLISEARYRMALQLAEEGEYEQAESLLYHLGSYSDSKEQYKRVKYTQADAEFADGQYIASAELFETLGGYSDSAEKALKARYSAAQSAEQNGSYSDAAELYAALDGFSDSADRELSCRYSYAGQLEKEKDYYGAAGVYSALGEHSDCAERYTECLYLGACADIDNAEYERALETFSIIADYRDSSDKIKETKYLYAEKLAQDGKYEDSVEMFRQILGYSDVLDRIHETRYYQAEAALADGDFGAAADYFSQAGEYSDAEVKETECKYKYAVSLGESGNYKKAAVILDSLGNYLDSAELALEMKYNDASMMRDNGYYEDAEKIFTELGSYSDAAAQAEYARKLKRLNISVGEYIEFGSYTQGSGGEVLPLEWVVLDKQDSRVLVISRYLVDFMPYGSLSWEESSVRKWLNNDFLNSAFTASEAAKITDSVIPNNDNEVAAIYGGCNTSDRVFLLNDEEVVHYLSDYYVRQTDYTKWAKQRLEKSIDATMAFDTAYSDSDGSAWWIRGAGRLYRVCCVNITGSINNNMMYGEEYVGVRPAMWIDLGD